MTQARPKPPAPSSIPMRQAPDPASRHRARSTRGSRGAPGTIVLACALACVLAPARSFAAQPFIWDQDTNGIDDRIETVHLNGWSASFELGDTTLRQRIEVIRGGPELLYSVYVRWKHTPTTADLQTLPLPAMPTPSRTGAVPATHSLATFAQVATVAATVPGVDRVEAAPLLYPGTRDGAAAIGVRDASSRVFPTVSQVAPAAAGHGGVVAFLDTGINDESEGGHRGHESVRGRCLGGALFVTADSVSQTPRSGSVNPADHGGQATHSHATHVSGIAVGSGSAGGYAMGVAPLAKFVDVKVLNDAGNGI